MSESLLEVEGLSVEFVSKSHSTLAVRDVNFSMAAGSSLALVGESGSGKSVTALALLGLVSTRNGRISGSVRFQGRDVLRLPPRQLRELRGAEIAMIFQDPLSSLNPVMSVGQQIAEVVRAHERVSRGAAKARARELLTLVRIPGAERRFGDFPHQFSGGMRQRVMIAAALACRPKLLIADEPTTALDVTVQAQILDLLRDLRTEFDMATLLITHDLAVVSEFSERIAVMYAGRIVETASTRDLLDAPGHPYTRGLLASTPQIESELGLRLTPIPGTPVQLLKAPTTCPFVTRCDQVLDRCREQEPPPFGPREIRCWLHEEGS
ncbi:ABC transporter ATP-binding protein [Dactylosporangium sucinum]|uniref:ABC transporter ATP-binding protein n=1 Tax=Dactylosporangium sucinum TaxID=1424081 RepID=A0A917X460_9ACTN|nr:ABC transporter ATP-binding protein [Dactylosporangium sucinum]GGM61890.1 ABC transporter ATP-binding protein [Dactylosporangium sucinum]